MLKRLRRKTVPHEAAYWLQQRALLFSMDDLDSLVNKLSESERQQTPGSLFVQAQQKASSGQIAAEAAVLQRILEVPGLPTRLHLATWHNLRQLAIKPAVEQASQIRGMVIERPDQAGRELLAAYQDHTAVVMKADGTLILWDRDDPQIASLIDALLATGVPVLQRAQPWHKPEPGPPAPGLTRISILTDQGLFFGQGPGKLLVRDKLGGPPLRKAEQLVDALSQHPEARKSTHNFRD